MVLDAAMWLRCMLAQCNCFTVCMFTHVIGMCIEPDSSTALHRVTGPPITPAPFTQSPLAHLPVQAAFAAGYLVRLEPVGEISRQVLPLYAQRGLHNVPMSALMNMVDKWQP
jgi:hypothetical protein